MLLGWYRYLRYDPYLRYCGTYLRYGTVGTYYCGTYGTAVPVPTVVLLISFGEQWPRNQCL